MSVRLPPRLLALTPGNLAGDELLARLGAAVAGGLEGVLVREPALEDGAFADLLARARELLGPQRWLGVHDRAHLARALGCDGLHLGFRSLPPTLARAVVGEDIAIGFSAHAHEEPSIRAGADYLFFGPVLETPSKQGFLEPVGFDGLSGECARSALPTWAIGGLAPRHVGQALAAGAKGVAVLAGILASEDPASATRSYLAALTRSVDESS